MNNAKEVVTQHDLLSIIQDFVSKSSGLSANTNLEGEVVIGQKGDAKEIKLRKTDLLDVLVRKDSEGKEFIQVNLIEERKILLTDQLVGFKPHPITDLDVSKLPKVVTTLDLISVFEAIEEASAVNRTGVSSEDTETLKKVFQAILQGGEDVGFNLTMERSWLKRLPSVGSKASA